MEEIEILAPAGSKEAFLASINAGANAVYLGGKLFSARAYASNFSNEELKDLIIYAHMRNVKVYVTVNTLMFEDEIKEAISFIEYLHKANVDAILIQDLGLAYYLHKVYPNLVLHASTQLNCHNVSEAKALMNLGFKRVVLARETPLEVAKEIKKLGVEVEVFVHGALCVSYSGNCLMSSLIGNRSGNRGKCAQPCRNYMICQNEKDKSNNFAISMKDLCTIDKINYLVDAKIDSLKIEGRMKREEYVYEVVSSYRKALDAYLNRNDVDTVLLKNNMKKLFNREFTNGFMFNESRTKTLNQKTSSHIGTHLGRVISKMNNYALIKLDDELLVGDGIRFNNKHQTGQEVQKMFVKGNDVISAKKGDTIKLLLRENEVFNNDEVIKTTSIKQLNEIHKEMKTYKKVEINIEIVSLLNEPLKMIGRYKDIEVKAISSYIVESSEKQIDINKLFNQVNRMGNSIFTLGDLKFSGMNNSFIPNSVLNDLRRKVIEDIEPRILDLYKFNENIVKNKYEVNVNYKNRDFKNYVQVENEMQLEEVIKYPYDKILVANDELYEKYKDDERIYHSLPRINENDKNETLDKEVISYLKIINSRDVMISPYMNITNSYALECVNELGANDVILSYELSKNRIKKMIEEYHLRNGVIPNTIIPVYGYIDLMIMKSCPISTMHNLSKDHCNMCKKYHYYLQDRMNTKFEMMHDDCCNTRILNSLPLYLIDNINDILDIGVKGTIVYFTNENVELVNKISTILFNKIENDTLLMFDKKTTKGHFKLDLE